VAGIEGINGRDVVGRGFARIKRGYDPAEVDAFLVELAVEIDRLRGQLAFRDEAAVTALRVALQTADEFVVEAEVEAERIFVEVFADAQKIRAEALEVAERIRDHATITAEQLRTAAELEATASLEAIEQLEREAHVASGRIRAEAAEVTEQLRTAAETHAAETARQARAEANSALEEAEVRAHEIVREACVEADRTLAVVGDETREVDVKATQARQVLEWQTGRLRSGSELMAQLAAELEELTVDGGDVVDLPLLFTEQARDQG
jgi:DivIVA domain-containing protein